MRPLKDHKKHTDLKDRDYPRSVLDLGNGHQMSFNDAKRLLPGVSTSTLYRWAKDVQKNGRQLNGQPRLIEGKEKFD
jgi:transposase